MQPPKIIIDAPVPLWMKPLNNFLRPIRDRDVHQFLGLWILSLLQNWVINTIAVFFFLQGGKGDSGPNGQSGRRVSQLAHIAGSYQAY